MKKNALTKKFEPQKCVIFAQSMKIGTHENKAIHSTLVMMSGVKPKVFRKRQFFQWPDSFNAMHCNNMTKIWSSLCHQPTGNSLECKWHIRNKVTIFNSSISICSCPNYCTCGYFRMGVIFAFFVLPSSLCKLPPRKNKTHMPFWRI